jgi:hypothetical protein
VPDSIHFFALAPVVLLPPEPAVPTVLIRERRKSHATVEVSPEYLNVFNNATQQRKRPDPEGGRELWSHHG